MANLTQTFAKRVKPPKTGYRIHYDSGTHGFGLRVTSNGAKSFVLNYRVHGRERRYTIGQMGAWTTETARQEAQRLRALVDRGADPFVLEEARNRQALEEEARQRTMKDLSNYYLSNHAEVHKRPRSIAEDKAMLESIILPRLGRMRASSITHRDVSELHASLKATPYRANRVLALLHKMFSFAAADTANEWCVTQNPATGIPRFHEEKRERWLSEDELQRLAVALQEYPDRCAADAEVSEKQREFLRTEAQRAVNAIRLSMVTGCRKSEALTSKWNDFDLVRHVWTKPSHHTKQKRTEYVPLSEQALSLLERLPRKGEYVFPGRTGAHLTDLKGPWAGPDRTWRVAASGLFVAIRYPVGRNLGRMTVEECRLLNIASLVTSGLSRYASPHPRTFWSRTGPSPVAHGVAGVVFPDMRLVRGTVCRKTPVNKLRRVSLHY